MTIPPVLFARTNFLRLMSIFIPVMVLIKDRASAPPASAARAISVMSVTFGLSFMITGCFAYFFISFVIASTAFGSCPKAIPPSFTFGQEILISSMSTGSSASRFTTSTYSSVECPHTFTIILVSYFFRNGISLSQNRSIPGFCNPTALSIPP